MILQVAIPVPLFKLFDYLPPESVDASVLRPGIRVQVPFGNQDNLCVGVVIDTVDHSEWPVAKLKTVTTILDTTPLLTTSDLELLQWASRYYHYPLGDMIDAVLPKLLTVVKKHRATVPVTVSEVTGHAASPSSLTLTPNQQHIIDAVCAHLGQFYPCLLEGVTGSGKTEVYLRIVQRVLDLGQQALILVPEINLTPQMLSRFQQSFNVPVVALHSKLSDSERLHAWLAARHGTAPIIVGTRSAVWTPLARLGVIIVDEEHDPSYKQQDHFRYSARDVAVMRAKQAQVPVVLGSATPSLDSVHNAQQGRYHHFELPERAGVAIPPQIDLVDMRALPPRVRVSPQLLAAIHDCLTRQQQVLLFINRRGYAPTLMCYHCGWVAQCQQCDAHLTYHGHSQQLHCHHCGAVLPLKMTCPQCQHPQLSLLGQGTERIEEWLRQQVPHARIARIDSDSTRAKRAMTTVLTQIHQGEIDILIGTQMLAKGHHFPKVTLVGIINIDGGLFGVDFRSSERMAQLLIQVAGRAGRADDPGRVIIQTYHPEHLVFRQLLQEGYAAFAQTALIERQQTAFPPFTHLALLRAEAKMAENALEFLEMAKVHAHSLNGHGVTVWGPVMAPMERCGGWYRAQLLLQADQRGVLHQLLDQWLPLVTGMSKQKVRWSLDVDPQDLL